MHDYREQRLKCLTGSLIFISNNTVLEFLFGAYKMCYLNDQVTCTLYTMVR